MNSVAYLPRSKCLLEQVSEVPRYQHFSLKTEQAYLYWIRFFVRWHGRDGQMQQPRSMGGAEVTQFLTMLANERRVSVSTHNQALSALLFFYRQVLAIDLPWLREVERPHRWVFFWLILGLDWYKRPYWWLRCGYTAKN